MTATLVWAAVKPWLKSLNLWLMLVIAGLGVTIWIGRGILHERKAALEAAKAEAKTSTATVAAAVETAKAAREAEEATPLPADMAAIVELCRKSASCRERGR
jgi:hypothetical protein